MRRETWYAPSTDMDMANGGLSSRADGNAPPPPADLARWSVWVMKKEGTEPPATLTANAPGDEKSKITEGADIIASVSSPRGKAAVKASEGNASRRPPLEEGSGVPTEKAAARD